MTRLLIVAVALVGGAVARADESEEKVVLQLAGVAANAKLLQPARLEALRTLGRMGPAARAAVGPLVKQLAGLRMGESPTLQEAIAETLGKIGPAALEALPTLTRAAGWDIDIDRAVAVAIRQILAPPDSLEIRDLMRQLRSADVSVRLRAAKALAAKGPKAEIAAPDLLALLQDADADVRRVALAALRAVQPHAKPADAVVQAYILDLQDADEGVRLLAAKSLGRMGPAAAAAAPALQKAAADSDPDVRKAAAEALARLTAN